MTTVVLIDEMSNVSLQEAGDILHNIMEQYAVAHTEDGKEAPPVFENTLPNIIRIASSVLIMEIGKAMKGNEKSAQLLAAIAIEAATKELDSDLKEFIEKHNKEEK
jgi:hypothetical protein